MSGRGLNREIKQENSWENKVFLDFMKKYR
ncbi:hypothetical protein BSPWISOXPB_8706 [uncultured Gammaproteobacteria bacterium]|jgi:hypothetical protein|nr:hypothetical protein BSPWISOXPB_8706 [uncultured Gammaproteobacteria bacterium]